ncbi:DUF4307 domain-containing protein [Streptomyces sp. NBC_01481]|uniref:DUF4307 domain-containing protein n=1 Tax=Streptomyces sp. NBC_01481 TaxID=2975869 RepID=UPI00224DB1CB|nr:DUF4307 domain-containing protein [Streptomyces sp. NBC_01481]MCX4586642.1 DUF4307 domain-containing protein [Streptomyces sp. NBC_01481]
MAAVREQLPEGRYGRSADDRADRKLKIVGAGLGVALLGIIGWFGYDYIAGQKISAEVIKFSVTSDTEVQVHLEVRKNADATGTCTLRSRSEDGSEVGRLDVAVGQGRTRIDEVVKVRTTARGTSAELVQCTAR